MVRIVVLSQYRYTKMAERHANGTRLVIADTVVQIALQYLHGKIPAIYSYLLTTETRAARKLVLNLVKLFFNGRRVFWIGCSLFFVSAFCMFEPFPRVALLVCMRDLTLPVIALFVVIDGVGCCTDLTPVVA